MLLQYFSLAILSVTTYFLLPVNKGYDLQTDWSLGTEEKRVQFKSLLKKYLSIYLLATFSDWLQGPYIYRLYHDYSFDDSVISKLFIVGFISSTLSGTIIGHLADCYGRKRICLLFFFLYALCCITKMFPVLWVLVLGRVLSGIGTGILFSTFSAWYIHEHQQHYQLPAEWMNTTFAWATFLNGFFAIVAGLISSVAADVFDWGPIAPFVIAIPVLLTAGAITALTWDENTGAESSHPKSFKYSAYKSLCLIFSRKDKTLLHLGIVQMFFEASMYTFVIAWSPILSTLKFSLGLVFAAFMLCMMMGSALYTASISQKRSSPEEMLSFTMRIATCAMLTLIVLTISELTELTSQICYIVFLVFEISVGIYFPAWGYLASRTVPEELRASVCSWFRFPMNILTCACLHWTSANEEMEPDKDPGSIYHSSFIVCTAYLIVACWSTERFSRHYKQKLTTTSNAATISELA